MTLSGLRGGPWPLLSVVQGGSSAPAPFETWREVSRYGIFEESRCGRHRARFERRSIQCSRSAGTRVPPPDPPAGSSDRAPARARSASPSPKHPDRHEQRHYDNFTYTHHAEGGVWKYGLRDGFWFSEYYHPTKCHTANIHVLGYEIKRKAHAGEWATARIPQFLGSPGLGYTTEC